MKATLYTDGGARGNPGPAGIGAVLKDDEGQVLKEVSEFIGHATNNVAEYCSLIAGLKAAKELNIDHCAVYMDSELVIKQMTGVYRVKNAALKKHWQEAQDLAKGISEVTFSHIRREINQEADALVNQAIDAAII